MYFDNLPNISIHNGGMSDITYTKNDIIYCALPVSILLLYNQWNLKESDMMRQLPYKNWNMTVIEGPCQFQHCTTLKLF